MRHDRTGRIYHDPVSRPAHVIESGDMHRCTICGAETRAEGRLLRTWFEFHGLCPFRGAQAGTSRSRASVQPPCPRPAQASLPGLCPAEQGSASKRFRRPESRAS